MADNVTLPGTGAVISTDQVGAGQQVQHVKLMDGTADGTTVIVAGNGVASGALRVTLASDGTGVVAATQSGTWNVTNAGTFAVQLSGAGLTALQLIDDVVYTDDTSTHATGTSKGVLLMAAATPTDSTVNSNDIGALAMSVDRRLLVDAQLVDQDTNIAVVAGGAFSVQEDGSALTALQLIDDIVATLGTTTYTETATKGAVIGAVRNDTLAALANTDNEIAPLQVDASGALYVTVSSGNIIAAGGVAHAAADSGNPLKLGAKCETTPSTITPVGDGNRTDCYADSDGLLMVKPYTSYPDILIETATNTDGASTAFTTFGATASTKNCVTTISACNSSGTNITVDIRDGTAGAVIWTLAVPAGGGSNVHFPVPLRQPTAGTALAFDGSAAATTLTISICGFKTKAI